MQSKTKKNKPTTTYFDKMKNPIKKKKKKKKKEKKNKQKTKKQQK
jgi:hypothetical protein